MIEQIFLGLILLVGLILLIGVILYITSRLLDDGQLCIKNNNPD